MEELWKEFRDYEHTHTHTHTHTQRERERERERESVYKDPAFALGHFALSFMAGMMTSKSYVTRAKWIYNFQMWSCWVCKCAIAFVVIKCRIPCSCCRTNHTIRMNKWFLSIVSNMGSKQWGWSHWQNFLVQYAFLFVQCLVLTCCVTLQSFDPRACWCCCFSGFSFTCGLSFHKLKSKHKSLQWWTGSWSLFVVFCSFFVVFFFSQSSVVFNAFLTTARRWDLGTLIYCLPFLQSLSHKFMPPPQTIQAAAFNVSLKKVSCHITLLLQSSPLHFGGFEMPHQLPIPESTTSYHSGVMVFSLLYFQYQHGLLGLCHNIHICNIIIFHLANPAISIACAELL